MRRSYALAVPLTVALAMAGCGGTTTRTVTAGAPAKTVALTPAEVKEKTTQEGAEKRAAAAHARKEAREHKAEEAAEAKTKHEEQKTEREEAKAVVKRYRAIHPHPRSRGMASLIAIEPKVWRRS